MVRQLIRRELKILQSVSDEIPAESLHGHGAHERNQQAKKESTKTTVFTQDLLQKQLKDETSSRAEMEREYMNLLSCLESEKRTTSELLDERTRERDDLRKKLSDLQSQADELCCAIEKNTKLHESDLKVLQAGLSARDSHLKEKSRELEETNAALDVATNSRGEIEMEYKNLLSSLESEKMSTTELLDERTRERDHLQKKLSDIQSQADELCRVTKKDRELHKSELDVVEANLCESDLHLKEQRRELEGTNAALEARIKENEALSKEAIESQTEKVALRRQLNEMKNEVDVLKSYHQDGAEAYEKSLEDMQAQAETQKLEIDQLKEERDTLSEARSGEVEDLYSNINAKDKENDMLRSLLITLEADARERDSNLQAKSQRFDDAQSELAEKAKKNEVLRMEVEELRRLQEEKAQRCDEMTKEINDLTSNRGVAAKHNDDRVGQLEAAVTKRDSRIKVKNKEIETLKAALKTSTVQVVALAKEGVIKMEEIDTLKSGIEAKSTEIEAKKEEINTLKSSIESKEIETLKAALKTSTVQVVVLAKEGATKMEEIDVLKSGLEAKSTEIDAKREKIEAKSKEVETLKAVLTTSTDQVGALAEQVCALAGELEMIREQYDDEKKRANRLEVQLDCVRSDRSAFDNVCPAMKDLQSKNSRLEADLAEKSSSADAMLVEIKAVEAILRDSQKRNDALEIEVQSLRESLKLASEKPEAPEKEVLITDLQMRTAHTMNEHNCEVESLRRELSAANMEKAEQEMKLINLQNEVVNLGKSKTTVTAALKHQLQHQASTNLSLQSTLKTKEDEIVKYTSLCESMKELASSRRDEVEDLQSELVQKSQELGEQKRSIENLKMSLDDSERKLKSTDILIAEPIGPFHPAPVSPEPIKGMKAIRDEQTIEDLSIENKELRQEVVDLVAELQRLREKFRDLRGKTNSSSQVKVLRSRNEALKKDVERATRRLKSLEKSITRVSC